MVTDIVWVTVLSDWHRKEMMGSPIALLLENEIIHSSWLSFISLKTGTDKAKCLRIENFHMIRVIFT